MSENAMLSLFAQAVPMQRLCCNAVMAEYTTFRIGGAADLLAKPESAEEVAALVRTAKENGIPFYIIGNGSNILVKDGGIRGIVILIRSSMSRVLVDDCTVYAQAGVTMGALALRLASAGLEGFEFASGIPGCLGGGIYMNAGAYNGEVGDLVKSVTILNEQGEIETLTHEQMDFSYRHSAVTGRDIAVLEAVLELKKGDPAQIMANIQDYSRRRRERQPLAYPSAGSMFKRPEGAYAAALIDQAHMKGVCVGAAQVSQKHAGFFINRGGATAKEMLELVEYVKLAVFADSGIVLQPEVRILGEDS